MPSTNASTTKGFVDNTQSLLNTLKHQHINLSASQLKTLTASLASRHKQHKTDDQIADYLSKHSLISQQLKARFKTTEQGDSNHNHKLDASELTALKAQLKSQLLADLVSPHISSVAITSAANAQNSTLNVGDVVSVTVTLSEATTVTGTPQLALNIGDSTVQANYASGSGTTSLVFNYTILAGQIDINGISIAANSLALNSGTMKDATGNNATITHTSVTDNTSYKVDTTAPTQTVSSVDISADTGASASDFITNTASQTITATLTAGLVSGEKLYGSTNGGSTWADITSKVSGATVTWTSATLTAGTSSIQMKVTDAAGNDGTVVSQNVTLDTTPPTAAVFDPPTSPMIQLEAIGVRYGADLAPQITAVGTAGEFVVTWYGIDSAGDNSIFVQKFNANGTTTGNMPVQLEAIGVTNGGDAFSQITAVGTAGEFVVTWTGADSANDSSIFVQKFNANGTTTGNMPVQLEAIGVRYGADFEPQITAVGTTGEFVVTWYGLDSANDFAIFVQKFNANGTTTGNMPVQLEAIGVTNGDDAFSQITAVGTAGEFVVTWYGIDSAGDNSIFVQKFNANGTTTNNTRGQLEAIGVTNGADLASQIAAVGTAGEFVVTWYGIDSTGDNSIFVQKFNANGTLYTPTVTDADGNTDSQVVVDTVTDADEIPPTASVTAVAIANNGNAVVQSTETGTAYLVKNTLAVSSLSDITSAADNQWNSVAISAVNTNINLSVAGLQQGAVYKVYTADTAGNLSAVASGTVVLSNTTTTNITLTDAGVTGDETQLIAPVQVEGKWYYYWDRSGDATSADSGSQNGGLDYTNHDALDGIFTRDINGIVGGGGNTTDTYRYATLNGVQVALPTANGGTAYPQGIILNGTAYTDAGASTNSTTSSFNELLAIWDAYNGTGTGISTNGRPSDWQGQAMGQAMIYWSATPSDSGHALVFLTVGQVSDTADYYYFGYVALQVL